MPHLNVCVRPALAAEDQASGWSSDVLKAPAYLKWKADQARANAKAIKEDVDRAEAPRRAADAAEAKQREIDRQWEAAQRYSEAALGYQRMSMEDFLLDYAEMLPGKGVSIFGYHVRSGKADILASGTGPNAEAVVLVTSQLAREYRKYLLECHADGAIWCLIRVRGHTGCTATRYGMPSDDPCLVIDWIGSAQ